MIEPSYIFENIRTIENADSAEEVLETIRTVFDKMEVRYYIFTIMPMPGQDINGYIILKKWDDVKTQKEHYFQSHEVAFQKALDWNNFFVLRAEYHQSSAMCLAAGLPDKTRDLAIIPIDSIYDIHAVCAFVFDVERYDNQDISMDFISYSHRTALRGLFGAAAIKLRLMDFLKERRNQVTKREKEVLELCAIGKTAEEIGYILDVSARTVTAHLQNASAKLHAQNKVQCVLQAIRYNQIGVGASGSKDFYEILRDYKN